MNAGATDRFLLIKLKGISIFIEIKLKQNNGMHD